MINICVHKYFTHAYMSYNQIYVYWYEHIKFAKHIVIDNRMS